MAWLAVYDDGDGQTRKEMRKQSPSTGHPEKRQQQRRREKECRGERRNGKKSHYKHTRHEKMGTQWHNERKSRELSEGKFIKN